MSFRSETRELSELITKNVKAGKGRDAMRLAVEEYEAIKAARATEPAEPKPDRNHGRTFLISFVFGALWQGSRRRR